MSDPLLDFLMTRDKDRVMREIVRVPLEKFYREGSDEARGVIDQMPIGVLRRRLLEAESKRKTPPRQEVRVIASEEVMRALANWKARAEKAEAEVERWRTGRVWTEEK